VNTSAASPKFWEGPIILTLSKQQYFVWDTAFESTKQQYILDGPFEPVAMPMNMK